MTTLLETRSESPGADRKPSPGEILARHGAGGVASRGLTLTRGLGARVVDEGGRAYLDCVAGHGAASLGHNHPALTAAIARQARQLISVSAAFDHGARACLVRRLAAVTGYERFFLCNSGTEAVEAAIKYARWSTGRRRLVACRGGFHGRTLGALAATHEPKYRRPFEPLDPGFSHVPFGDAAALERALEEACESASGGSGDSGDEVAAVLLEPIQGEGGVHLPPAGYLQAVRRLCDRFGALMILDEVQTGLGRTGRWLAQDHWLPTGEPTARADLVTLAKGLGGGVPIGALALRPGLDPFPAGAHGSTFGGNPLASAAAAAVLAVMEREDLPGRAAKLGVFALESLRRRLNGAPLVREVRGLGLMVAVDLRRRVGPWLRRLQQEEAILALPAGPTVLRLLPPLTIPREDWRDVVTRVGDLLAGEAPA